MPVTPRSNRSSLWLFGALIWVTLGLMSAAQNATWRAFIGRPIEWGSILPNSLGDWLTCGMFTPAFYWMVRQFPIRGERWWARIPVHLVGSIAFTLLKVSIWTPLYNLLNPGEARTYVQILVNGFYADMLAYWAAVGVIHAIEYYRESRERQLEATRLALDNLRAQLQPHFLFNTLQSISTLIHRDQSAADRMLTDLSELLRLSLRNPGSQEVPLREELEFLERYLQIMRVRFGDRLVIAVDAQPDVMDALVPSLVLQPIVENAIQHGMADRQDRGDVAVRAQREDGMLILEVRDDGLGFSSPLSRRERGSGGEDETERGSGGEDETERGSGGEDGGIGLANTRERLQRLYGADGRMEILRDKGFTVRLVMPLR